MSTRGRSRLMTVAAGPVTAGGTAPVPPPAAVRPGPLRCPGWPTGSSCSASTRTPATASRRRWCGGPTARSSRCRRLLYLVACRIDGSRDPAAIAELVSDDLGRSLTADQVRYLITAKLLPLGIVAAEGAPAAAADGQPAARAPGAGHAAARTGRQRRRGAAAAAVPVARRRGRGRQRRWPWTTGCSPSTGWAAGSGRSCATRRTCSSCSACPWSPPRSTSAGTRPAAATAARGPA